MPGESETHDDLPSAVDCFSSINDSLWGGIIQLWVARGGGFLIDLQGVSGSVQDLMALGGARRGREERGWLIWGGRGARQRIVNYDGA